jgi:hypothetical protein
MKYLNRVILVAALLMALPACAPLSETARADLEFSRGDFRNKFIEDRTRCHAQGRRIVIVAWGGSVDRDGIPRTRVPYTCT